MAASPGRPPFFADALLHPIPLAAIALLVVNDHLLKPAFPGAVTGKLSDFAGLAFFPLFLVGVGEVISRRLASTRALALACGATAVVFALVKTWHPAGELYRYGLAALQWPYFAASAAWSGHGVPGLRTTALVRDATDLVALPAVAVAWCVGRRRSREPVARSLPTEALVRAGVVLVAAVASTATSYATVGAELAVSPVQLTPEAPTAVRRYTLAFDPNDAENDPPQDLRVSLLCIARIEDPAGASEVETTKSLRATVLVESSGESTEFTTKESILPSAFVGCRTDTSCFDTLRLTLELLPEAAIKSLTVSARLSLDSNVIDTRNKITITEVSP